MTRLIFYFLLGFAPGLAEARAFRPLGPDDLMPMATLVCNGIVMKLEKVSDEKEPAGSLWTGTSWRAHIKGLAAFKGTMPPEFDFVYTEKFYPINGPMEFQLAEGQRYRFFLKQALTTPDYISVLENQMDNVWSVEALGPNEPDTSAPLQKVEAMRLALDYYHLKRPPTATIENPREQASRVLSHGVDPNIWMVNFWFENSNVHDIAPDAEVLILGDRTIEANSWIATGPGLPANKIDSTDVGRACWIRIKPSNKDSDYGNEDLRGTIRAITPRAIILKDAHDRWGDYHRPLLAVEDEDIRVVQIIRP